MAPVVACDPDIAALRVARRRGRASQVLLVARAEALPFAAGAFETVVSSLVFCSVDLPARRSRRGTPGAGDGGRLRMIEHVRADGSLLAWWQDRVQPLWTTLSGGCRPNRRTEATVEAEGFVIVRATRRARGTLRRFEAMPPVVPRPRGATRGPSRGLAVKRAEKAARIGTTLDELYPEPPIPLVHADPFTLLVAVMLSAQTTDARVNLVTPALFARAATPRRDGAAPGRAILAVIRTCGLAPTKARNLKRTAELLVAEHGGEVPADLAALERLPGVGHKTASVVMARRSASPAFPVDTHIHRLAARWGLSQRPLGRAHRDRPEASSSRAPTWARRHLQIIYFGREHCPARGHDLEACPICSWAATAVRERAESSTRSRG